MPNKPSDSVKFIWILGLVAALVIGLNWGAWALVKKARREFVEKKTKVMAATAERPDLSQLKKEYEYSGLNQRQLEASFAAPDRMVDVIVALENLAQATGNTISIKASDSGQAKSGAAIFKLDISGSYGGLANFLARLESFGYLITPLKIEAARSYNSETKKSGLKTSLNIKVWTL